MHLGLLLAFHFDCHVYSLIVITMLLDVVILYVRDCFGRKLSFVLHRLHLQ